MDRPIGVKRRLGLGGQTARVTMCRCTSRSCTINGRSNAVMLHTADNVWLPRCKSADQTNASMIHGETAWAALAAKTLSDRDNASTRKGILEVCDPCLDGQINTVLVRFRRPLHVGQACSWGIRQRTRTLRKFPWCAIAGTRYTASGKAPVRAKCNNPFLIVRLDRDREST